MFSGPTPCSPISQSPDKAPVGWPLYPSLDPVIYKFHSIPTIPCNFSVSPKLRFHLYQSNTVGQHSLYALNPGHIPYTASTIVAPPASQQTRLLWEDYYSATTNGPCNLQAPLFLQTQAFITASVASEAQTLPTPIEGRGTLEEQVPPAPIGKRDR